ncbi:MAG: hypothetical protein ACYC35_20300 [Pirellulales bacterium]
MLGRFNPYIIHPEWLTKEGIIAEGEAVEAEIAIGGREVAFRFKTGDFAWKVDYSRLIVSTEKNGDTAAIVAKVVEKLPHTPLMAIGNNFRYRCNRSKWTGRLPTLDDIGPDQLRAYGDVQSVGWKASVTQSGGVTLNTEVSLDLTEPVSPMLTVNVNYHRPVSSATELIAAAQRFAEDQKASVTFLESLLREKVEP